MGTYGKSFGFCTTTHFDITVEDNDVEECFKTENGPLELKQRMMEELGELIDEYLLDKCECCYPDIDTDELDYKLTYRVGVIITDDDEDDDEK